MKIPKMQFKKFFRRGERDVHPLRDWIFLLTTSFVILVVVGFVGFSVSQPLPIDEASIGAPVVRTINQEKLSATVKVFAEKKAIFDALWEKRPDYQSPL